MSDRPHYKVVTRRKFLQIASFTALGALVYGDVFGRHRIQISAQTFRIRNLPNAFSGFKIVQLSDIHFGEFTESWFLERVVRVVNNLNPDLVLLTGDYTNRPSKFLSREVSLERAKDCALLLGKLACKERYGILGNHDVEAGAEDVRRIFEQHGIRILRNEFAAIQRDGDDLVLAGTDSLSQGYPNLSSAIPEHPTGPVILMLHEPDLAFRVATHPRGRLVDLMLAGHTHGGQICVPIFGPLFLPPFGRIFPEGNYVVGGNELYVNRGIGTVGVPFRFNCLPEISVHTLVASD